VFFDEELLSKEQSLKGQNACIYSVCVVDVYEKEADLSAFPTREKWKGVV
jgi:hypothetical protein